MDLKERYEKLIEKRDSIKNEISRAKGSLESLEGELEKNMAFLNSLGLKSLEEAEETEKALEAEITKIMAETEEVLIERG